MNARIEDTADAGKQFAVKLYRRKQRCTALLNYSKVIGVFWNPVKYTAIDEESYNTAYIQFETK